MNDRRHIDGEIGAHGILRADVKRLIVLGCAALALAGCSTIAARMPKSYASCNCYEDAYNGNGQPLLFGHSWKM